MRSAFLVSSVLAAAAVAGPAYAVGGTLTDGAVSLTYPSTHWSGDGYADFKGTRPNPADDVVSSSGWWYRVNGSDTREYSLPAPSVENYNGASAALTHTNVDGKGFNVTEYLNLTDNEGPSGAYTSSLCIENTNLGNLDLSLFHYLDADANGTYAGDYGWEVRHGFLTFSETDTIIYRADSFTGWMARPYAASDSLLTRLNDNAVDDFDNSGLPNLLSTDMAMGYQWKLQIAGGATACYAAQVTVASRELHWSTKGDLNDLNYAPDILLENPSTGELRAWNMRRTQEFQIWYYSNLPANRDVVGTDDFRGTYVNNLLTRDRVTGVVYLDGAQLQAPTVPLNWQLAATGDVDSDGRADIVWRNLISQKIVIWTMNGTQKVGALSPVPDQAANSNWEIVALADFNGDGTRDFLWYNVTSGNLVIWYLDNSHQRIGATFTNPTNAGGNNWRPVAAGDYGTGPGGVNNTQDILWRNSTSGKLVVWHMDFAGVRTAGEFTSPDAPYGTPTDWQVVGPR